MLLVSICLHANNNNDQKQSFMNVFQGSGFQNIICIYLHKLQKEVSIPLSNVRHNSKKHLTRNKRCHEYVLSNYC